ncbi:hypothetical protein [Tenuibacillus multivorans]|uniref:Uncharacterized protein n=1 Tax=Tenuibacillus multivorans TaxID=237069 RepID=A0A1H0DEV2_9BACI|nr:hypothetical protein [Tenuibacillus multivorans]GEL76580.1 hypothetical protein TMU01_08150 [Tenuibacillus multivorans]SDN68690.1 hypothetical protein SAMN05216498_2845 [Tenuibacillus multivorans]
MNQKLEKLKKEIINKVTEMVTVLTSGFLVINFSLFTFFIEDNSRLVWTLDIAVFNLIVSTAFTLLYIIYSFYKAEINVSVKNKVEGVNKLTLDPLGYAKIFCEFKLIGKSKKFNNCFIRLSFPSWITPQVDQEPFLNFDEGKNQILIDLEKLLSRQNFNNTEGSIPIMVISNSSRYNKVFLKLEHEPTVSIYRKLLYKYKTTGMEIVNKEGES